MVKPEGLDGIDVFVAAAEAGSFARAGQRLHRSRSAVGKSVARLEDRLGVRLFHRTTRQQSLTPEGEKFYERCLRVMAELEAAEAEIQQGKSAPRGRLRVSVPVIFGRRIVAPILSDLTRIHPELEVHISFSDRLVDLVEEGFDLSVRLGPLADSTSLAVRKLGTVTMALGAAPAYLAAYGRPRSVRDLEEHAGIVYERHGGDGGMRTAWLVHDGGVAREVEPQSRLRFDDVEAIADAAAQGFGIAYLPSWLLDSYVKAGALELVLDGRRTRYNEVHAVWPKARYVPSKLRAAIDALAERVPPAIGGSTPSARSSRKAETS
jgi:DNA-binding transcriptional LysR family regulator